MRKTMRLSCAAISKSVAEPPASGVPSTFSLKGEAAPRSNPTCAIRTAFDALLYTVKRYVLVALPLITVSRATVSVLKVSLSFGETV